MPFNLAPVVSAFLRRSVKKGMAEVTGNKVNRGAWRFHAHTISLICSIHRATKDYCGEAEL